MAQYDGLIEVQSLGQGQGTLFIFSMKMDIATAPNILFEMSFGEDASGRNSRCSEVLGGAENEVNIEEEKVEICSVD